jgi:hypothetical protein
MRRRDIDLIMGLVDGTIDDEAEARARVMSSPSLRAEYEAQLRAREALRAVPIAALSDTERASLRRDVWTGLTASEGSKPRVSRWVYATAGGFALVATVAVAGLLGGNGDMAGVVAVESDGGSESPVTTATMSTAGDAAVPEATAAPPEATDEDQFAAFAMQAREGAIPVETPDEATTSCLEQAGVGDLDFIGEAEEDGARYALLAPDLETLGTETPIVFVDLETCSVTHRDG